jgi:uncharacterized membrane protein YhhN
VIYFAAVTGVLVVFLLLAERKGDRLGRAVFKLMASTSFVGFALAAGAPGWDYGRWILAALVLSWLGDAFLLSRKKAPFTAGLVAFLLAHLAFGGAFLVLGIEWRVTAISALALAALGIGVARWLVPRVERNLRPPVLAYLVVISAMVALGMGAFGAEGSALLLVAPLAFYLSDLAVARDRFVSAGFVNRLWGLPLYYAAQILFAVSTRLLPA